MKAGEKIMDILKPLNIDIHENHLISIVGGGGKTTLMYNLSQAYKIHKKRVLLSTTAHIYIPPRDAYDDLFISESKDALLEHTEVITDVGIYVIGYNITAENKIKGIDISLVDELYARNRFDSILIEADGSKRKPVKAPAEWEPMVPQSTTITIGVIGLDSLGKSAGEETVHRLDEFCRVCGCLPGDRIDERMLAKLIEHPQGLFKNTPENAKKVVLLNKADNNQLIEAGFKIKNMAEDDNISYIIAALKNNVYWM